MRNIMRLRQLTAGQIATALPLTLSVCLLALFTVPNYLKAASYQREAVAAESRAIHAAARKDGIRLKQQDIERLRKDLAERGRRLPATPDKGELLGTLGRLGERKGVMANQSKSSRMGVVPVPGVTGGKAARRSVESQMSGPFEALFETLSATETLPTLVTVRCVEFTRGASAADASAPLEARFTFDEYFAERAANATAEGHGGSGS